MRFNARAHQRIPRFCTLISLLLVCSAAHTAAAQLSGRAVGEDEAPIGGEPVYGVPEWDPPIGGAPVYGVPIEEDAPAGGVPIGPQAEWNPPLGSAPVYGEPVEEDDVPIGGEPLY